MTTSFTFDPNRYDIQVEIAADKDVDNEKTVHEQKLILKPELNTNDPHLLQIFDHDTGITHQLEIGPSDTPEETYQYLCEKIKHIQRHETT